MQIKICIPNFDKQKIGGGWSFLTNFINGAREGFILCDSVDMADVLFIPAPTMVDRSYVERAKTLGKKIVLRIDGVPENWRNRGTGWSRTKEFADMADVVIYQSKFIRNTVGSLLEQTLKKQLNNKIILNGVDTEVFNPQGEKNPQFGDPSYLYVNYRKGEHNKRVEEVIERFRYLKLIKRHATLTLVGNYPKEQFLWDSKHWDFGMLDMVEGIDWQYLGIISDRNALAKIMRSCDYLAFPSFADPCPNTLIEGLACGLRPVWVNDYGGAKEIVDMWDPDYFTKERMANEYLKVMQDILQ
jgi:glycosyltransferase involved in cell wall biosynthesis